MRIMKITIQWPENEPGGWVIPILIANPEPGHGAAGERERGGAGFAADRSPQAARGGGRPD